jgi:uncharacterized protein (DUF849 family)
MVQVCLNGPRAAADGAMVPLTPRAMADAAAAAVAAGATDVHVHPKTPCGQDSLSPRVVPATLEAIRARVSVPVGVTTGAWAQPDPAPDTAEDTTHALLADLGSAHGRPVLLHGEDGGAWPVLRPAGRLGLATRTGLEDTLSLPGGQRAGSNARLAAEALVRYRQAAEGHDAAGR